MNDPLVNYGNADSVTTATSLAEASQRVRQIWPKPATASALRSELVNGTASGTHLNSEQVTGLSEIIGLS